jgi:SAM-dependent methyltransferase
MWFSEREQVVDAFDRPPLRGDVLELTSGTGIWTERLVRTANFVTAIDASPEMVGIYRDRLGPAASRVRFEVADVFMWPTRRSDAVAFCFWLSHVPRYCVGNFLGVVAAALHLEGRCFFVDSKRDPRSTAADHVLPEGEVMTLRLNDGSEYRVVKNFCSSAELKRRFPAAGLSVSVHETPTHFVYGIGDRQETSDTGAVERGDGR